MKKLFSTTHAISLIFLEVLIGISSSFLVGFVFLKFARDVVEKELFHYDLLISTFVYHLRTPVLTKIIMVTTNLGASYTLIGLLIIVIFLIHRHHQKEALLFIIMTSMGLAINLLLKSLIALPRPLISPLIHESTYTFPSGHSMNSFVFYSTIAFYMFHFTRNKKLSLYTGIACVLIIVYIGFTRIYLGVHYPSDVLGGYCIGLWWFITALLIDKSFYFFKLYKNHQKD